MIHRDVNNKITTYVVGFFGMIIIGIGSFFIYKNFAPEQEIFGGIEVDPDLNNIVIKEIEDGQWEREYVEYEQTACDFDGELVGHGDSRSFYSRNVVGVHEFCGDFSDQKTCIEGAWIGEKKFSYTSCERTVDCLIGEDVLLKNGESIEMFSKDVVLYGDDCSRYSKIRTCEETQLTGGSQFKYRTCSVSEAGVCNVTDANGNTEKIANRTSRLFFSQDTVSYNDICKKYAENRFCLNGELDGDASYTYLYCKQIPAQSCFINGFEIEHGGEKILYSKSQATEDKTCGFFAQIRECNNGVLLGQEEYSEDSCQDL